MEFSLMVHQSQHFPLQEKQKQKRIAGHWQQLDSLVLLHGVSYMKSTGLKEIIEGIGDV